MSRKPILGLGLCLGILSLGFSFSPAGWEKLSASPYGAYIKRMLVLTEKQTVILGTDRLIYRSEDWGRNFSAVFTPPGMKKEINDFYSNFQNKGDIYAATDNGAYVSHDEGKKWENIFTPADLDERQCLAISADEHTVYVGTKKGLFFKTLSAASWQKSTGELGRTAVFYIEQDAQYIYVATAKDLFRLKKDHSETKKLFSALAQESEETLEGLDVSDENSFLPSQFIKALDVIQKPSRIYLATNERIVMSLDAGETWADVPTNGLPLGLVNTLTVLNDEHLPSLVVGTDRGAFLYKEGKWEALYKGLESNRINFLTQDVSGNIYAATDSGIFFMRRTAAGPARLSHQKNSWAGGPKAGSLPPASDFYNEPSIQDVHTFVVDYAEVSPQKILAWRQGAKTRALLPTLSVGIDRSATELLHWDSGPNPDNLLKGKDYLDWDVSLSWDLGDIVWNPDQTSIDSRSKLMVELREGLMDQVTRLYFERRRLQMELLNADSLEPSLKSEKEMRIEELTALIDGMTGGKFSQSINVR